MEPNFRPKHPCRCPKVTKLSDNKSIQESNSKMTTNYKETCRKIHQKSDWSDSEDGKDNQARSNPIDVQDPQPSTSYARDSVPLRCPNIYQKVLNLGRGRGKGKFPLGNWTSVVKGCGHGLINADDQFTDPSHATRARKESCNSCTHGQNCIYRQDSNL